MLNWFRRTFGEVAIDRAFDELPAEEIAPPAPRDPTFGDLLKKAGLKVAHFRAEATPYGLASARDTTVVYRPRQDSRHTIEVATAVCSVRDAFDRRQGAFLAFKRFLSGERVHLPPNQREQSDYELLQGIFG